LSLPLLLICKANGHKISKIAKLSEEEITTLATQLLLATSQNPTDHVDHFVKYIMELEELLIQKKLAELLAQMGMPRLYSDVIIPLLRLSATDFFFLLLALPHRRWK
jgi:hypothetical protein